MSQSGPARRLAAIVSADVAGYSRLMEADEAGTLAALKRHRAELIDPKVAEHDGRVVGTAGDSLLIEFASVVGAVQCAVEVQRAMADRNANLPADRRMELRMGVNLGDVMVDGADIHGDGVNVAARLEKLAEPGGVVISGTVREHIAGKLDYAFADMGEQQVKNIARPVRAWRLEVGDLARTGASEGRADDTARRRQSIAVLPFANMSGEPEQEYFSDGITEDLITALARHHGLFVIARNSSFVFKGKAVAISEVGRKLGVRYLVEGSVRKSGKRIRVTAQLIDAETGAHLWAEKYDRDLEDVFAVQDEIVETLVWRVAGHVTKAELAGLKRRRTPDLNAYDLYLAGLELAHRFNMEDTRRAIALFERAIAIDPGFGRAYNGLAFSLASITAQTGNEDNRERAFTMLMKAVEVGDADEETYAHLAMLHRSRNERDETDACIGKALAINPNNPFVVYWHGWILFLRGDLLGAFECAERVCRLNPFPLPWEYELLGATSFLLGRNEDALRAFGHAKPNSYYGHYFVAAALAESGRLEEGRRHMAEAMRLRPQLSAHDVPAFDPFSPEITAKFVEALRKVGLPE